VIFSWLLRLNPFLIQLHHLMIIYMCSLLLPIVTRSQSASCCLQRDNFIHNFCQIMSGDFEIIIDLQVHPKLCSGVKYLDSLSAVSILTPLFCLSTSLIMDAGIRRAIARALTLILNGSRYLCVLTFEILYHK